MKSFLVCKKDIGTRLDIFASAKLHLSRSFTQQLIKEGKILLNSTIVKPHTKISVDQKISVSEWQTNNKKVNKLPKLDICYEDKDILVVNKQAGILVHPAKDQEKGSTLADALVHYLPSLKKVGDSPVRPGLVHRLDKMASGLLLVAKTPEAFLFLKKSFQERKVQKEYFVLVYGSLTKETDSIRFKLARSKKSGKIVARPEQHEQGKEAITQYDVLKHYKTTTFLRVKIETGRTHQIRVHFRAIDHPVVGDSLYKKQNMKNIRPLKLERLFLHATQLSLSLPQGEQKTFVSPLPQELSSILQTLPQKTL